MKHLTTLILLSCMLAVSCSDNQSAQVTDENEALGRATALVAELSQSVDTDYTLSPAVWNDIPVISITVNSADSDYMPTVESILRFTSSFEGELQLAVQKPMEPSDSEKASGVKDGMFSLAHFDAKTGERIP